MPRLDGTHLCPEDLDDEIREEVEQFGRWVAEKGNFKSLTAEIHKCENKNVAKKLEPVLKGLEYKVRNQSWFLQVLPKQS